MVRIITGEEIATSVNGTSRQEIALLKGRGCTPTLAIVRVGDQSKSAAYQVGTTRRYDKIDIAVQSLILPKNNTLSGILEAIEALNQSPPVHGVLLLRPLPAYLDNRIIHDVLCCGKDVDGVTSLSLYGTFTGVQQGFLPCTAQACTDTPDYCDISLRGKRAVMMGANLVTDRPVATMLLARGVTVILCHIDMAGLPSECRRTELIIAAVGAHALLNQDCLSPEQVILDIGVTTGPDGRLYSDVDFEATDAVVEALAPVLGGIGTVTTTILIRRMIEAAK